jgi:hypothetical protein
VGGFGGVEGVAWNWVLWGSRERTITVRGVDDRVFVLERLCHASNEAEGALWGGVDGDELEGAEWLCLGGCVGHDGVCGQLSVKDVGCGSALGYIGGWL